MKTVSIADAKNQLTSLLYEAEEGRPVQLTRRGQPVAVLLSEHEYEQLKTAAASTMDFAAWAQAWRARQVENFEGITPAELERWQESF